MAESADKKSSKQVLEIAQQQWATLTREEQERFTELAREDDQRYSQEKEAGFPNNIHFGIFINRSETFLFWKAQMCFGL